MTEPLRFRSVEISDPAYEQDGLRTVTVKSPALQRRADVSLWIPQHAGDLSIDTLLLLLHGVYGSHWVWPLKAGVHRTAQRLLSAGRIAPMVIAMPGDGLARDGSGYLTLAPGEDLERWILDEVPAIARLAAPALTNDARIAIAGLSMGAYGALRLGAKYPERFFAISAHSAITCLEDMASFVEEPLSEYSSAGASEELSAIYWLRRHRDRLPRLRFDCGTADPLITSNRALHAALTESHIAHTFEELPGKHSWPYWQTNVERTLRFVSDHGNRG